MINADFQYFNFHLNTSTIQNYIENTVAERKYMRWHSNRGAYEAPLTDSIINAIAGNKVKFDINNTELVETLDKLIRKCGYGTDGTYTESAHQAMKNLCIMRGINPDNAKLYDHTLSGRIAQGKEKIKGFFGFGKKKQDEQKVVATQPANKKSVVGAFIAGAALMGLTTMLTGDKINEKSDAPAQPKKTENVRTTTSANTLKITPVVQNKTVATKQTKPANVNDPQLQAINNFCDTSLDILMGAQKRDSLYNKIQAQVDKGIFKIPNGMSVQRIAHAMEMSRIYEGKSVILDALNTDKQLTDAQQNAFEEHINGIGIRGEKLQQRMSKKQKLSSHSKFDRSSYAKQQAHIKNLKQLRQMRGR